MSIVFVFQYNGNGDKIEVKTESFDESSATEKSQTQSSSAQSQGNTAQSQVSTSNATASKSFADANVNEGNNITILVAKTIPSKNDYNENGHISDRKHADHLNSSNNRDTRNIVTEQIVWIASNPRGNFTAHPTPNHIHTDTHPHSYTNSHTPRQTATKISRRCGLANLDKLYSTQT